MFRGLTIIFLRDFALGLWLMFPVLFFLLALITVLGQLVGRREGWSRLDSFYWAFVTKAVAFDDLVTLWGVLKP